ncbi:MAG: qcrB, partial [Armatimonadetes bacterium]|nr:qcrB [Armatimonadota bacterium]
MLARIQEWLRDRTSVAPTAASGGLPKGVGWLHTLGIVAVALLLVEAVTGFALSLYYSPHPDAAYESVRYIDKVLPMGGLVRGLHHYGAAALIVVLGLHLTRTYVQGAYKAPREAVWLSGLVLINLVIVFGVTGELLPWDQDAYHGTVVRTMYAEGVPVIGPTAAIMLRGGPDIGALTLTRFYAIHILLLPAILFGLGYAHVLWARRKGPTIPTTMVGAEPRPASGVVQRQMQKALWAVVLTFIAIFALAAARPAELDFKANPSDPSYHARAEWHLLFLFQLVKDWGGFKPLARFSWIPAVVIPGIAMTFLALAPWIDRSPDRRPSKRPMMMALLVIALLGVGGLTAKAYATLHPNATPEDSLYGHFTGGDRTPLDAEQLKVGAAAFQACGGCHTAYHDYTTGHGGPD